MCAGARAPMPRAVSSCSRGFSMAGRFPWWLVFFLLFFALQGSSALAAQQSAAPVRYRYLIDPSRSRVSFTFRGLAIPFDGHFGVVEGELFLDGGDIARGSSFWMKIPAASVRAGAKQQERMFLDIVLEADAHPFIEYKSTSLRLAAPVTKEGRENQYRLVVRGKLRLHGVERERGSRPPGGHGNGFVHPGKGHDPSFGLRYGPPAGAGSDSERGCHRGDRPAGFGTRAAESAAVKGRIFPDPVRRSAVLPKGKPLL